MNRKPTPPATVAEARKRLADLRAARAVPGAPAAPDEVVKHASEEPAPASDHVRALLQQIARVPS